MTLRKAIILGGLILTVLGAGHALAVLSEVLIYFRLFKTKAFISIVYILVRCPQSVLLLACGLFSIMKPDVIEQLVEKINHRHANNNLERTSQ